MQIHAVLRVGASMFQHMCTYFACPSHAFVYGPLRVRWGQRPDAPPPAGRALSAVLKAAGGADRVSGRAAPCQAVTAPRGPPALIAG